MANLLFSSQDIITTKDEISFIIEVGLDDLSLEEIDEVGLDLLSPEEMDLNFCYVFPWNRRI